MEEIQPILSNFDYIKSKNQDDNCENNNCNIKNSISDKKLWLNDLKIIKQFDLKRSQQLKLELFRFVI